MKYWAKSWNTIYGCTRYRSGCDSCWGRAMSRRMQANGMLDGVVDAEGEWTGKIVFKSERLDMPHSWKKPQIVAVDWMSDIFHKNVPAGVWPATLKVMMDNPQHTYLILTKRYEELMLKLYPGDVADHVFIGVTISNKRDAELAHIPLSFANRMGWKTWVSYEPALESIDWRGYEWLNGLVCGGETGSRPRFMPFEAARSARDFCQRSNIPFTFKSWGPRNMGRLLDGKDWFEFPNRRAGEQE